MIDRRVVKGTVRIVLSWYKKYHRSLPWRKTRDPYQILVSEVMLQQTQVDRVVAKYKEFLKKFPTIRVLAQAPTAEVIRAWKGLGYNRRALYLQGAAQMIVTEHRGKFPKSIVQLKRLPGVGEYTARAILAFAFGEAIPVLDTNHRRFYQRVLFGIQPKADRELLQAATALLPTRRAWDWNQALMDFGSLVCLTGRPKCESCPVRRLCRAYPRIQLPSVSNRQKTESGKQTNTPFRDSDRYFRGRIIDTLREKEKGTDQFFKKQFPELSRKRYRSIVSALEKDGLLKRAGAHILLP